MQPSEWGHTNPIVSPLYGRPPLHWRDMRVLLVVYETDTDNILRVIPAPLEPRTNRVIAWVSRFDLGSTQGAFAEAAIYVQVRLGELEGDYEPFLYVDSHLPLTAGREIWGFQKKMAQIELVHEYEAVRGQVNRLGHQVLKALVVPEYAADMDEVGWSRDGVFSLRNIPSPEEHGTPIRELVLTQGRFTAQEGRLFGGRASIICERSEIDPTYLLEPTRIVGGYYGQGDLYLPHGRIVHTYADRG